MTNKQPGYRYENDWTKKELEEILKIVNIGITLPVNTEIKADQTVLNLDEAKQYLTKASKIALRDCTCRTARKHCSHSLDTCFALNGLAEFNVKNGISKEISLREAMGILERAHEEGLVHMAYVLLKDSNLDREVNSICCCCSCCCNMLAATQRFGLALNILVSDTASVTDSTKCTLCGICVARCQFGAREIKDGSLEYRPERCMGCGLCVSKCPSLAISLVKKK
ncbi:hypothetical protein A3K78_03420 [Candidatus Bathyarchaeota archaeon RBG_13_52_12]|nr:MAG: hypothetical protein A3K78_03420 [Candidatus Bathyarchaeota archaeon RBG_13_52_12]